MDMMRRRSEPGLSPTANEAEGNRGDGGEERQQVVQALTDGREVAMIQPTSQVENEVVPVPAANPFWSERAQEEGDWIAMIEPMLSSLTDTGRVWWQCVYSKAYQAYAKWLSVSPLERLGIKAELEGLKVVRTVHVLLEQRAVSLLLQAIPERLKTEIVSTRMLGSVMIFTNC